MFTIEAIQGSSSAKTNEAVLHAGNTKTPSKDIYLLCVSFVDLLALFSDK